MKKILVLSELRDDVFRELSEKYELITEYDSSKIELIIADSELSDEKIPCRAKILRVLHESGHHAACDDFILYPFRAGELSTRVERLLRCSSLFENGSLAIDFERCSVSLNGQGVHLTLLEYRLLCLLARNCGVTVDYQTIMNELWGSPIGNEIKSVRVFVNALRRKLGDASLIKNAMGKGYVMPKITK